MTVNCKTCVHDIVLFIIQSRKLKCTVLVLQHSAVHADGWARYNYRIIRLVQSCNICQTGNLPFRQIETGTACESILFILLCILYDMLIKRCYTTQQERTIHKKSWDSYLKWNNLKININNNYRKVIVLIALDSYHTVLPRNSYTVR